MRHASKSSSPARHPIRALVLTPTRELAVQVSENAASYSKHTDLRAAVVYGGVDMKEQVAILRNGVEILIATPGRLLDHIGSKVANLSQVEILVLDEADRMLDMGFLPDLQRIIDLIPAQRQTLLFSATFSPEIKKLAQSYLRTPVTIEVARQNAAADTVKQVVHMVPSADKQNAIVRILEARTRLGLSRQCIIFTNSRLGCARLSRALERDGIKAGAIHGDKSQGERTLTLDAFKSGAIEALVATDVAARGLDIPDMPCANWMCCRSPKEVQRQAELLSQVGLRPQAEAHQHKLHQPKCQTHFSICLMSLPRLLKRLILMDLLCQR